MVPSAVKRFVANESHLISCLLTFGCIWHHVLVMQAQIDTADLEDLSKDDRYLD